MSDLRGLYVAALPNTMLTSSFFTVVGDYFYCYCAVYLFSKDFRTTTMLSYDKMTASQVLF